MKRKIFSINLKKFSLVFALIGILFFSACLKDNGPGSENYSHSPALVGFQYLGFTPVPLIAGIPGTPQDSVNVEVTLSVATITLSNPVTVTIAVDQASLDAFNADTTRSTYPTIYTMLPSDEFSLANGGVVTINPGQQIVDLVIRFAGDKVDFAQDYAIALKITGVQGATLASNLNTAILLVKLKSIYEGNYAISGARIRFNGPSEASGILDSFAITGTTFFSTVAGKEIDGALGDPLGSGFTMALLIHDDQPAPYPVDVLPDPATVGSGGSPTVIKPGTARGQSTYDPTTKTFDLHFGYINASGNLREVNEQMVFQP